MRKYHQLVLLIVSAISLSLFLVYRHEYNRLHYVLEVFNFFGQPCNVTGTEISQNILSHRDWGPTPIWQESGGVYFYSAFWTNKSEVLAIGLQPSEAVEIRNCYLWFEDKKKHVMGKFSLSKGACDTTKQCVYHYYCAITSSHRLPYAVSFKAKGNKNNAFKKILITNSQIKRTFINMTICAAPTTFSKSSFIEFLSFHQLIGVDSFIFYSENIPHRLMKIISNLSRRLGIQVTFFPWNYPKDEGILSRIIIENDCILRNNNQSNYVITLELDEYLVPTNMFTINDVFKNYVNSEKLSFPVQTFCIENTDPRKPLALQNIKVEYNDSNSVIFAHHYISSVGHKPPRTSFNNFASIHKYINCEKSSLRTFYDNSILKFSTDFTRSTLFQLLVHKHL